VALSLGLAGGVPQAAAAASSPSRQVAKASAQIRRIPRTAFAPKRRGVVLGFAAAARRSLRRGATCKAIAAVDRLASELATPTNFKRAKVPRSARKPRILLKQAGTALVRKAGTKCAKPAKEIRLKAQKGGAGFTPVPGPPNPSDQGEGEEENERTPAGTYRPPKTVGGSSGLGADPFGLPEGPAPGTPGAQLRSLPRNPSASAAADPLQFFRISDAGVPPRNGCCPEEPTTAEGHNVVWQTDNSSVALSTDAGRTFTGFDPSTILPDSGLPLCCDQVVSYSPRYNIFIWIIQYWCGRGSTTTNDCRTAGTTSNRIRLAVASPESLRANATHPGFAWTYWDLTPQLFGHPAGAWFDRSDMGVNFWNWQWTVDTLRGNASSLLARVSLSALAARGSISLGYIKDTPQRMTVAQGDNGSTTVFAGNNSLSQARIWSWQPFSGTLFRHDINHSSVPINTSSITGSDGGNWYSRFGIFPGAVESATVSGNTLYVAQGTGRDQCTANCGAATPTLHRVFAMPAVFVSKYDVNSWTKTGERWLWNPTLGFGWPALSTAGSGEVGIALRSASAGQNARPVAGFLTADEEFVFAIPAGMPHLTGDYYSLRPGRTSRSFVMTTQTAQSDGRHWGFVEFGRGASPYVAPPSVHITAPANLTSFAFAANAGYTAAVSDPVDGTLPAAAIRWTEDGTFIGSGPSIHHVESTPGTHTIMVRATNGDGRSATDAITIVVQPPPPSDIKVTITSPSDNSSFGPGVFNQLRNEYCKDIPFTATASGGKGALLYGWTDSRDGGQPQQVSTDLSPTLTLCGGSSFSQSSIHLLTLNASDGATSASTKITVTVFTPQLG
jgi:hypothetical protein